VVPGHLRAVAGQLDGTVRARLLEPQEGQVPVRVRPQLLVLDNLYTYGPVGGRDLVESLPARRRPRPPPGRR
jgi:hypothetical protein